MFEETVIALIPIGYLIGRREQTLFTLEIKKNCRSSNDLDIHHSKFSSFKFDLLFIQKSILSNIMVSMMSITSTTQYFIYKIMKINKEYTPSSCPGRNRFPFYFILRTTLYILRLNWFYIYVCSWILDDWLYCLSACKTVKFLFLSFNQINCFSLKP